MVVTGALALSLGVLAWTVTEYVVHRWSMHAGTGPAMVARGHARHHREPTRRPLASPLSVAAVSFAGLTVLPAIGAWAAHLAGLPATTGALVGPGFAGGYLFYERLHHRIHLGTTPTRYGRARLHDHMRHHSGPMTGNYGVTSHLWDVVFRTYAAGPSPALKSPTEGPPVAHSASKSKSS